MSASGITRRELVQRGGFLSLLPALLRGGTVSAEPVAAPAAAAGAGLRLGPEIYQSIGVRPFVNARGTFTIITGSTLLPEVRAAMADASKHYVHLDELAEALGQRLAELTKAEWGMVTTGCSAALTHATAACVTGGNPDLHVRLPDLRGFPRDECVIPRHSRNVYDAAVRAVGVRVVEVSTAEELAAAFGPRTALAYILAGPNADEGPCSTKAVCEQAKKHGVPVLVDAAAEIMTVPNVHLQLGADLVGYSGGKCLRGPQAAGLLLGRKDLIKAAWVGSAPHHGFGRGFKVGKEEAIGMLMAVEMWFKRDHDAEWKQWQAWLDHIAKKLTAIDGVTTSVTQPQGLSNRMPTLQIRWDAAKLGVAGDVVARQLFAETPRVSLFPARGRLQPGETGLSIGPYMMAPGDEQVVADRIVAVLKSAKRSEEKPKAPPTADLTGVWDIRIQYAASSSTHALHLRQRGSEIDGLHQGDFVTRDARGTIDGDAVRIRSEYPESLGDAINCTFTGTLAGDEMGGELDMGEYLKARWTAKRRAGERA
ncbi:MAG TPA: aminotransferase class V-fold PLP-dependent enzyme [Vicinamibacteria bacterium]